MRAGEGKFGRGVIERGGIPPVHRMTCSAGDRETSGDMTRITRSVEISLMAIETIPMKTDKNIIHVAICAQNCLMRSNEREGRHSMVECGWGPDGCCMTLVACMAEITREMAGSGCLIEIALVALEAIHEREEVIPSCMAGLALDRCVLSGKRKLRCRMVE